MTADIADDVVSYEHGTPLRYMGLPAVREVFDASGAVAWTKPDLQILVRGDLAVAWGLDRITVEQGDASAESWSRGTRVFRRAEDGQWRMVLPASVLPRDRRTGEAGTDLRP
ncbi:YybH family protein [Streptomyces sp. NPDC020780]|uniref:YybH family protein n=1 Tax=unclassified Streptomyces TaxID=2593676 RepID=UPI003795F693